MLNLLQMQQDKTKELMTEHFLLPKTSLGVFSGNFFYVCLCGMLWIRNAFLSDGNMKIMGLLVFSSVYKFEK